MRGVVRRKAVPVPFSKQSSRGHGLQSVEDGLDFYLADLAFYGGEFKELIFGPCLSAGFVPARGSLRFGRHDLALSVDAMGFLKPCPPKLLGRSFGLDAFRYIFRMTHACPARIANVDGNRGDLGPRISHSRQLDQVGYSTPHITRRLLQLVSVLLFAVHPP